MSKWLKWKMMLFIICIIVTFGRFETWCKESLLYYLAFYLRVYVVVDFMYLCCVLQSKYNEKAMYSFYYTCIYMVFLIVVFFLTTKLIKVLKEVKNGQIT